MTDLRAGARADLSPLETEFSARVGYLLDRLSVRERQAQAALPRGEHAPRWPSWSLDTGLTREQEEFVEAWSPRRVLEESRELRQLILSLQTWIGTHRSEADLQQALTMLARLPQR